MVTTLYGTHITISRNGKDHSIPTGLFINGEFVPSRSGKRFTTVDPATGDIIAQVYEAFKEDVDAAVTAAQKALPKWKNTPARERGNLIYKLAGLIERDSKELAEIEALDNGKPVNVAHQVDVKGVVECLRYYAGWADKITGQTYEVQPGLNAYTKLEPFGVVGQIIPWNFPLMMLAWKWGPALATGNTIVMKTSEKTPLSALKVCELAMEAGFPPGVINVLSGFGPTAGDAIARHPNISKVAFTGSTVAGRKVMTAAAESNLKKVSLELGGKSPNIVFDDADLDEAVEAAFIAIFFNHGQCCAAGSRLYIQENIYEEFVEKFKEKMATIKIGDPFDTETNHGPLVDSLQYDRVLNYIDIGKSEGAKCDVGGGRIGNKGFFVQPTLFTGVEENMTIAKEEIFGPVVCAIRFKTEEEVIRKANQTNYGLAAAVHSKDIDRVLRVVGALQAGTVWVNCYNVFTQQTPFGGYKESGIGRECGEYALREYTQVKSVIMKVKPSLAF